MTDGGEKTLENVGLAIIGGLNLTFVLVEILAFCFLDPTGFQRTGAALIALMFLIYPLSRYALKEIEGQIFTPNAVMHPDHEGTLEQIRSIFDDDPELKIRARVSFRRLEITVLTNEALWAFFATVQWGFGDLFSEFAWRVIEGPSGTL